MSLLAIVTLVAIQAFFGLVTYIHNPGKRVNWYFLLFVGFIVLWSVSNFLSDNYYSVFWNRMTFAGAVGIFFTLFQFSDIFPDD